MQDPVYAASKFYDRLVKVPGWETGRLTEVAQTVQRIGFPEAYQQLGGDGDRADDGRPRLSRHCG